MIPEFTLCLYCTFLCWYVISDFSKLLENKQSYSGIIWSIEFMVVCSIFWFLFNTQQAYRIFFEYLINLEGQLLWAHLHNPSD